MSQSYNMVMQGGIKREGVKLDILFNQIIFRISFMFPKPSTPRLCRRWVMQDMVEFHQIIQSYELEGIGRRLYIQ